MHAILRARFLVGIARRLSFSACLLFSSYLHITDTIYSIQYATASQDDLGAWTYADADAFPDDGFPSWANSNNGYTWAPAVMNIGGTFTMYYTARDISANTQCIGRATSASAAGPFSDSSDSPFVCQNSLGGTIDAQPFQDTDGSLYLLYKNDGNSIGIPTGIWIQQLSSDGSALEVAAIMLVTSGSAWDHGIVEGPYLQTCQGDKYCLFFSGSYYASCSYSVGVATASAVTGPYTKDASNPVLSSTGAVCGPGGESLFDASGPYSAIHSWNNQSYNYRAMSLVGVTDGSADSSSYFATPTYGVSTCQ